MTLSFKSTLI